MSSTGRLAVVDDDDDDDAPRDRRMARRRWGQKGEKKDSRAFVATDKGNLRKGARGM